MKIRDELKIVLLGSLVILFMGLTLEIINKYYLLLPKDLVLLIPYTILSGLLSTASILFVIHLDNKELVKNE